MKQLKYFLPAFIVMMVIFFFSHQAGSSSSQYSLRIVTFFREHFSLAISELLIRKITHVLSFTILALTFAYAFSQFHYSLTDELILTFFSTFLYACLDEYHQLFIIGRSGQWQDILIDSLGALLVVGCLYYKKRHQ